MPNDSERRDFNSDSYQAVAQIAETKAILQAHIHEDNRREERVTRAIETVSVAIGRITADISAGAIATTEAIATLKGENAVFTVKLRNQHAIITTVIIGVFKLGEAIIGIFTSHSASAATKIIGG